MLEELRNQIDDIDGKIIQLLAQRMEVVKKIGTFKKQNNAIIYRPEREKYILDRLEKLSKGSLLTRSAIDAVFMEIFAISRNFELPERVSYLGPEGSFTHQAAESRFGIMSDYIPLNNIRSVFESVITERVRFGVVPIENNQEGFVKETLDLFYEMDVKIVAEILLPIHMTFVSKSDKLSEIKQIYSKEIAFYQCRNFLNEYFQEGTVEFIPVDSTSKAAKIASEDPHAAAICAAVAAKIYQTPILFENIEDSPNNLTRFFIISKDFSNQRSGYDKSNIIVKLRDEVGSLANFLQDFNAHNVNLFKIESRPARGDRHFKSWFYIELDGHIEDDNVRTIINKHADKLKFLGSYVKQY